MADNMEIGNNRLLLEVPDVGSMGARKGVVLGAVTETGTNTFVGLDLGVGFRIGYGKLLALQAKEIASLSTYEEITGDYRYFFLNKAHRFGVNWTMPSAKLVQTSSPTQLRIPFSIGLFGHYAPGSLSGCTPTYVGIDEPPQQQCAGGAATKSSVKPSLAGFVRAMIGFDLLPYQPKMPVRISMNVGPELGGGVRDGSGRLWLGISFMLEVAGIPR